MSDIETFDTRSMEKINLKFESAMIVIYFDVEYFLTFE